MEQGMNDTLKVAGRIGAELGAAKAECEKLRGLLAETLRYIDDETATAAMMSRLAARIDNALSQQAEPDDDVPDFTPGNGNKARRRMEALGIAPKVEPKCSTCNDVGIVWHSMICPGCVDTWTPPDEQADPAETTEAYTARDMATAAARGFRDGQAAVEQAAAQTAPQKYDDVLLPFLSMMRAELHANAGKGDRPGWLAMDVKTALLEIFYHIGKLQKAAKKGDRDGIREYSADVANMSMMLADICGVLPEYQAQPAPQSEQSGLVEATLPAVRAAERLSSAIIHRMTDRQYQKVRSEFGDLQDALVVCRAALSAQRGEA
jgi:hypothetical protein